VSEKYQRTPKKNVEDHHRGRTVKNKEEPRGKRKEKKNTTLISGLICNF
jgi:hypothetical protein